MVISAHWIILFALYRLTVISFIKPYQNSSVAIIFVAIIFVAFTIYRMRVQISKILLWDEQFISYLQEHGKYSTAKRLQRINRVTIFI